MVVDAGAPNNLIEELIEQFPIREDQYLVLSASQVREGGREGGREKERERALSSKTLLSPTNRLLVAIPLKNLS